MIFYEFVLFFSLSVRYLYGPHPAGSRISVGKWSLGQEWESRMHCRVNWRRCRYAWTPYLFFLVLTVKGRCECGSGRRAPQPSRSPHRNLWTATVRSLLRAAQMYWSIEIYRDVLSNSILEQLIELIEEYSYTWSQETYVLHSFDGIYSSKT